MIGYAVPTYVHTYVCDSVAYKIHTVAAMFHRKHSDTMNNDWVVNLRLDAGGSRYKVRFYATDRLAKIILNLL